MPEGLEAEYARQLLEERALGRTIARVHAPDAWFLKRGLTPTAARRVLKGRTTVTARRRGKLILLDTDACTIGLHLGMSGRLLVDGDAAGDPLLYASNRDAPEWVRFGFTFTDGSSFGLRDPRRLGAVELDPDEDRLGADVFTITLAQFRAAVSHRKAPLKAVLMDQSRIAGLGNLLADEILWRAGFDPTRRANSLTDDDLRVLHRTVKKTVTQLLQRGGSHTGDLMVARHPGGYCPKDGAPLERRTVGGRTTFSCPAHQR
ncbi:MAG: Fpg/Nei family DNA glycosylase [Acidimicrobiia bacterium]